MDSLRSCRARHGGGGWFLRLPMEKTRVCETPCSCGFAAFLPIKADFFHRPVEFPILHAQLPRRLAVPQLAA